MCSFEGAGKESTRREDSIGVLSVGFPKREESKGNGIILDSSMVVQRHGRTPKRIEQKFNNPR